jgi:GTPase SAR1 family protein
MGHISRDGSIAMWGPPSSGKSWLIKAFVRDLEISNGNDAQFSYHLSHKDRSGSWCKSFANTPKVAPTRTHCNYDWRFERRGNNIAATQDNARTHFLQLFDDPGESTFRALIETEQYWNTYRTLKNVTQGVIVALDHTIFNQGYTKKKYAIEVQRLCALLQESAGTDNKPRYAAVCITKMDRGLLGSIKNRTPLELIEGTFGADMFRFLEKAQKNESGGLSLKCFKTSSVGFLNQQPNYDEGQDDLRNEGHWYPWKASEPFLWILDQMNLT